MLNIERKSNLNADLLMVLTAEEAGVTEPRKEWLLRALQAEALARELVVIIDELRRQINECGLDDEMWEVYERAKNWINTPHHK